LPLIVPTATRKSVAVCRLLLKMGIECIAASDGHAAAMSPRFDEAREFALMGSRKRGTRWWYMQHLNPTYQQKSHTDYTIGNWLSSVGMMLIENDGVQLLMAIFPLLTLTAPLETGTYPSPESIDEPWAMAFMV